VTGEKRVDIDQKVATFQAIDADTVYARGTDGRPWRELSTHTQAIPVDGPLLVGAGGGAFRAKDAEHIYVLGNDHKLWAETMPAGR
jgi:hypothetical protein